MDDCGVDSGNVEAFGVIFGVFGGSGLEAREGHGMWDCCVNGEVQRIFIAFVDGF